MNFLKKIVKSKNEGQEEVLDEDVKRILQELKIHSTADDSVSQSSSSLKQKFSIRSKSKEGSSGGSKSSRNKHHVEEEVFSIDNLAINSNIDHLDLNNTPVIHSASQISTQLFQTNPPEFSANSDISVRQSYTGVIAPPTCPPPVLNQPPPPRDKPTSAFAYKNTPMKPTYLDKQMDNELTVVWVNSDVFKEKSSPIKDFWVRSGFKLKCFKDSDKCIRWLKKQAIVYEKATIGSKFDSMVFGTQNQSITGKILANSHNRNEEEFVKGNTGQMTMTELILGNSDSISLTKGESNICSNCQRCIEFTPCPCYYDSLSLNKEDTSTTTPYLIFIIPNEDILPYLYYIRDAVISVIISQEESMVTRYTPSSISTTSLQYVIVPTIPHLMYTGDVAGQKELLPFSIIRTIGPFLAVSIKLVYLCTRPDFIEKVRRELHRPYEFSNDIYYLNTNILFPQSMFRDLFTTCIESSSLSPADYVKYLIDQLERKSYWTGQSVREKPPLIAWSAPRVFLEAELISMFGLDVDEIKPFCEYVKTIFK